MMIEHTITSHAWLSGYAGWNEHNLCISECLLQAIGVRLVASDNALGIYVAKISGDT